MLKEQEEIIVENSDIQYQEGIVEALDKYPLTDMVILKDDIIGELNLEDLILSITMVKNDIEIILITEQEIKFVQNKNIIKVINDKKNYVKLIFEYLHESVYIKNKKVTNTKDKKAEMKGRDETENKTGYNIQTWKVSNKRNNMGKIQKIVKKRIAKHEKVKNEIIYELPKQITEILKEEFLIEFRLKEKQAEKLRIEIDENNIKITII